MAARTLKGWATWLAALVLAVLLPPLGLWLARGRGRALWISLLGCAAAAGAFLAMAAAGLALWGVAIAHAVIVLAAFGLRPQDKGDAR